MLALIVILASRTIGAIVSLVAVVRDDVKTSPEIARVVALGVGIGTIVGIVTAVVTGYLRFS